MSIPIVNVEEVSQGSIGVLAAMTHAVWMFGNSTVAFFLERVPERGEELWQRFKSYQGEHQEASFADFLKSILTADPIKLFYPRECTLDTMTRKLLASAVLTAVRPSGASTENDLLQIYFGEGPAYNAARNISCKGCPMSRCKHFLNPHRNPHGQKKRW